MHHHRPARFIDRSQHGHVAETDKEFAHARRVNNHRGSPASDWLDTVRFAEPLCRARDPHPATTSPSDPKSPERGSVPARPTTTATLRSSTEELA
jgi:hypothetical protein